MNSAVIIVVDARGKSLSTIADEGFKRIWYKAYSLPFLRSFVDMKRDQSHHPLMATQAIKILLL